MRPLPHLLDLVAQAPSADHQCTYAVLGKCMQSSSIASQAQPQLCLKQSDALCLCKELMPAKMSDHQMASKQCTACSPTCRQEARMSLRCVSHDYLRPALACFKLWLWRVNACIEHRLTCRVLKTAYIFRWLLCIGHTIPAGHKPLPADTHQHRTHGRQPGCVFCHDGQAWKCFPPGNRAPTKPGAS